jgi:hypothetical protein
VKWIVLAIELNDVSRRRLNVYSQNYDLRAPTPPALEAEVDMAFHPQTPAAASPSSCSASSHPQFVFVAEHVSPFCASRWDGHQLSMFLPWWEYSCRTQWLFDSYRGTRRRRLRWSPRSREIFCVELHAFLCSTATKFEWPRTRLAPCRDQQYPCCWLVWRRWLGSTV